MPPLVHLTGYILTQIYPKTVISIYVVINTIFFEHLQMSPFTIKIMTCVFLK